MAGIYLFTLLAGQVLEKLKAPWLFAALFFGFALSITFPQIAGDEAFSFLAEIGMAVLLFTVGLEIDLGELLRNAPKYTAYAFILELSEAFIAGLFINAFFQVSLPIAMLVGLSFATVGEAVLIPILEEFGALKTRLGEVIVGVGVADDLLEVIVIAIAALLISHRGEAPLHHILLILGTVILLFFLSAILKKIKAARRLRFPQIEELVLASLAILFLFLSIGELADLGPLAAILAGVAVRSFLPKRAMKEIERSLKAIGYGVFAPIFFAWVGTTTNFTYLFENPIIVLLLFIITAMAKLLAATIAIRDIPVLQRIIAGVGLCTRFSTGLIVAEYIYRAGVIPTDLFSVIVATTALYSLTIPLLFSILLGRVSIHNRTQKARA